MSHLHFQVEQILRHPKFELCKEIKILQAPTPDDRGFVQELPLRPSPIT